MVKETLYVRHHSDIFFRRSLNVHGGVQRTFPCITRDDLALLLSPWSSFPNKFLFQEHRRVPTQLSNSTLKCPIHNYENVGPTDINNMLHKYALCLWSMLLMLVGPITSIVNYWQCVSTLLITGIKIASVIVLVQVRCVKTPSS